MRYVGNPTWEKLVKRGVELPGLDGTYWRLLKRFPVEEVSRWCTGERIRGVPMEQLMDAMAMYVGSCIIQVAGQTGRKMVMQAAAKMLRGTANLVHLDVQQIVENKKDIELIMRKGLKH